MLPGGEGKSPLKILYLNLSSFESKSILSHFSYHLVVLLLRWLVKSWLKLLLWCSVLLGCLILMTTINSALHHWCLIHWSLLLLWSTADHWSTTFLRHNFRRRSRRHVNNHKVLFRFCIDSHLLMTGQVTLLKDNCSRCRFLQALFLHKPRSLDLILKLLNEFKRQIAFHFFRHGFVQRPQELSL